MKLFLFLPLFFVVFIILQPQKKLGLEVISIGANTSLRGMSIPSDEVIWVSGSNGTIAKSVDAGKTWGWMTLPGFERRDFRDIHAFDSLTAISMTVDNPATIVKTTNGGATWKKVYEKAQEGMFLDAMDFKNETEGICIGDPLPTTKASEKRFFIIRTFDGGDSWEEIAVEQRPVAQSGEAIFAASGTNISFFDSSDFEYGFVTGGVVSNLYLMAKNGKQNKKCRLPIIQGRETTGTFSMTRNSQAIYCIGGDYKDVASRFKNYVYTTDKGDRWNSSRVTAPFGYRSCICIINNNALVACGATGVDISGYRGNEWKKVSLESFNVCPATKGGEVFLGGEKGKIGRLILADKKGIIQLR